jgi:acyl-CoA thioester hydrolase
MAVRWRDLDMLGHLNQAVYHEFLEEARTALLEPVLHDSGMSFVLARVEVDYRAEVRKDHGTVDVVARLEGLGRSSMTVAHEIVLPDGTVAAEGRSILVAWDRDQRRSRPLSVAERSLLAPEG